jgi:hypothetical protein
MSRIDFVITGVIASLIIAVVYAGVSADNRAQRRCDYAFKSAKSASDSLLVIRANPVCNRV